MTAPRDIPEEAVEAAARAGHAAYEDLAPAIGYSTRVRTRVPWDELAHDMQILMLHAYRAGIAAASPFLSAERDALLARAEAAEADAAALGAMLDVAQEGLDATEARADRLAEELRDAVRVSSGELRHVPGVHATHVCDACKALVRARAALADALTEPARDRDTEKEEG